MPLFKNIKENNCLIGIWELSETLDHLKKKYNNSIIEKINSDKTLNGRNSRPQSCL